MKCSRELFCIGYDLGVLDSDLKVISLFCYSLYGTKAFLPGIAVSKISRLETDVFGIRNIETIV